MTPQALTDRLGHLRARIADLKGREEVLRSELIDSGVEEADGKLFHAIVSHQTVDLVNYKAIVEKIGPPPRIVKQYTTHEERVQVRVTARSSR